MTYGELEVAVFDVHTAKERQVEAWLHHQATPVHAHHFAHVGADVSSLQAGEVETGLVVDGGREVGAHIDYGVAWWVGGKFQRLRFGLWSLTEAEFWRGKRKA